MYVITDIKSGNVIDICTVLETQPGSKEKNWLFDGERAITKSEVTVHIYNGEIPQDALTKNYKFNDNVGFWRTDNSPTENYQNGYDDAISDVIGEAKK